MLLGLALLGALRLNRSAEQRGEIAVLGRMMLLFGRFAAVLIPRLRRLTVVR